MFQSGLFEYAVECSSGKLIIQVPGNSEYALFMVMFELPVTSLSSYHEPAGLFNYSYDLLNFIFCHLKELLFKEPFNQNKINGIGYFKSILFQLF